MKHNPVYSGIFKAGKYHGDFMNSYPEANSQITRNMGNKVGIAVKLSNFTL